MPLFKKKKKKKKNLESLLVNQCDRTVSVIRRHISERATSSVTSELLHVRSFLIMENVFDLCNKCMTDGQKDGRGGEYVCSIEAWGGGHGNLYVLGPVLSQASKIIQILCGGRKVIFFRFMQNIRHEEVAI